MVLGFSQIFFFVCNEAQEQGGEVLCGHEAATHVAFQSISQGDSVIIINSTTAIGLSVCLLVPDPGGGILASNDASGCLQMLAMYEQTQKIHGSV